MFGIWSSELRVSDLGSRLWELNLRLRVWQGCRFRLEGCWLRVFRIEGFMSKEILGGRDGGPKSA